MDFVAEPKQELSQIGAVLAGDAGNQGNTPLRILNHIFSNKAAATPPAGHNAGHNI